MKRIYLDAVRRAVDAYSSDRIDAYIAGVEADGIKEHGFARLAANIGMLLANGEVPEYEDRFIRMTDIFCNTLMSAKEKNGLAVGNDFSVREICTCIEALEDAGILCGKTAEWRKLLAEIDPYKTYSRTVTPETPKPNNWAMFVAASEQARAHMGMAVDGDFIDRQIASQLWRFDGNGMYRDPHCPMVYDLVTRALSAFILKYGYNGKWADELRNNLLKSVDLTIEMQSVDGEIAFGGRSNQMLMTEGWYAALCEYYISVLDRDDDRRGLLAGCLDSACEFTRCWTEKDGYSHVKNHYPTDSGIGCEGYAYFDKYMVTLGSVYTLADLLCGDDKPVAMPRESFVSAAGEDFHKIFMHNGSIFAEIETHADFSYDANGIGRVHFKGAPPALVLSVPCPRGECRYRTETINSLPLSLCPVLKTSDGLITAAGPGTDYEPEEFREGPDTAFLSLTSRLEDGTEFFESITLDGEMFSYTVGGDGECGTAVPVFLTDGMTETEREITDKRITVSYEGYKAVFETDGLFENTGLECSGRNGKYAFYTATDDGGVTLSIKVSTAV